MPDRLSEHFTRAELACRCCGACEIDPALVTGLEALRAALGKPVIVTSGYRCPAHNAAEGGAKHSMHVRGKATDVRVAGMTAREVYAVARSIPQFRGFGVSDSGGFVHVDTRDVAARWCYHAGREAPWTEAA